MYPVGCLSLIYFLIQTFQCIITFMLSNQGHTVLVGPCHHGMARPQVADRGTASDKEGSCE